MLEDFFLNHKASDEVNAKSLADLYRISFDSALNAIVWLRARPSMAGSLTYSDIDHMLDHNMI